MSRLRRARTAVPATRRPPSLPPPRAEPLSRAYRLALGGIGLGIAVSFATLVVGLVLLQRQSLPELSAAGQSAGVREVASQGRPPAPAKVDIAARHRGKLKLDITAGITIGGNALTKAEVVAYTDMTQMPGAHRSRPFVMAEADPGVYKARTQLPMLGNYEVRVEVRSPIRTAARKVVAVGLVRSQSSSR